ncbi:21615_t:CDS:2 [Cetraspora pellucida]|uniref:21615_t:CDS:1 n=1 Tax=Cetraspora pellucida TaxID=1433469 RepID=A0A9N9E1H3_9GLOM|nr:21615_t:CDS:2 [Cetraspora pellucida]
MILNKKQKKQELSKNPKRSRISNDNYAFQSSEPIESSIENAETTSENEECISDTNDNLLQNSDSIPDSYRPLSKASASKLGSEQTCNIICNTGGLTGNMWDHLSSWIINNAQLLYLLESQKFKAFVATLDPYYELPTRKAVKSMIHDAYNFSSNILKQKLRDTATSYLLICNLWTSRNHKASLVLPVIGSIRISN